MASQRVAETGFSGSGPSDHHIPYGVLHGVGINNHPSSFINEEGSRFDFGELEEAIALQGVKSVKINNNEAKAPLFTARSAATLDIFPSWPLRFHHTPRGSSQSGEESTDTLSSKGAEAEADTEIAQPAAQPNPEKRKGSGTTSQKVLDAKTLRRLAQNREAAKKSRLRKKAYVQQLESSRIKLAQLEQDLQRARAQQGLVFGGGSGGGIGGNISSGATVFDMEYARWMDDDHRHMLGLRTGLQSHLPDGDLRVIVDGYIAHYDDVFRLRGVATKSDVLHLITGMWTTPAERCFLWMGGFRPSDLIKMLKTQLDPLTEQQVMGICNLQHSSQQTEEALSQGLEQLQQSLIDTISGDSVHGGIHHMALALGKLTNLEGFVRQADNLRQQTLHRLCRILTVRQVARCFLVIGEYYDRLRALNSL